MPCPALPCPGIYLPPLEQIIDLVVLVVDAAKGIQTQTAECIVIGEVAAGDMVVALNKIGGVGRGSCRCLRVPACAGGCLCWCTLLHACTCM